MPQEQSNREEEAEETPTLLSEEAEAVAGANHHYDEETGEEPAFTESSLYVTYILMRAALRQQNRTSGYMRPSRRDSFMNKLGIVLFGTPLVTLLLCVHMFTVFVHDLIALAVPEARRTPLMWLYFGDGRRAGIHTKDIQRFFRRKFLVARDDSGEPIHPMIL